jgi:sugar phosphate isomerase/epimerase
MESRMDIGCAMGITGDDVREFIRFAQDLGIERIVLNHWIHEKLDMYREWKKMFDGEGLRVECWAIPHWSAEMLFPGEGRDHGMTMIETSLANLEVLEVDTAHTFGFLPRASEPKDEQNQWDAMIDLYRETLRRAADHGVRICVHYGWGEDLMVWNTDTLVRLHNEIPDKNLGVLYCPGCFYSAGDDVVETARRLKGRIFLVHARDSEKIGPECVNMHLGDGKVPYRDLLRALDETGYTGVVVPEHLGGVSMQAREELSQALAIGYLRGLLESVRD